MNIKGEAKDKFEQGIGAFTRGDYKSSVDLFCEVVEIAPDYDLAYIGRGAALMRCGKPGKALGDFDQAIRLRPQNDRAFNLRGLAHSQMEQYEAALEDFNQAIALNGSYGAAYLNRASVYDALQRPDDAAEDLQTASHLTQRNLQQFADKNKIWQSEQLRLDADDITSSMQR